MTERSPLSTQQRLLRVPVGSSIPHSWRFVQWVGKETNQFSGRWEDVVLCELDEGTPDSAETTDRVAE